MVKYTLIGVTAFIYCLAFVLGTPGDILHGMKNILTSQNMLISDYFLIGGACAALFNCALVMTITIATLHFLKINFTGISFAAVLIMGGFSLFGKNPLNIAPILLGTYLYSRAQGLSLNRYIYIGFFSTTLAPLISSLAFILPFSMPINIVLSTALGVFIGFISPPLAAHTVSMHMGYSLFNSGFSGGILALCVVSLARSFGLLVNSVLIWRDGVSITAVASLFTIFITLAFVGWLRCGKTFRPFIRIMRHPGRAIADFVLMDGTGATLINMAACGAICTLYIIIIGGDLNGPTIGGIMTISGFAAFGIHPKNYTPVLAGVALAGVLKVFSISVPTQQLASIFCAGLAPIAGQFGVFAGLTAGFLQSSVVVGLSALTGGVNLYNNGFAAGFVAIVLVPLIESFKKKYD